MGEAQPTVGDVYQSEETQQIIANFKQHAQRQEELVMSEWENVKTGFEQILRDLQELNVSGD